MARLRRERRSPPGSLAPGAYVVLSGGEPILYLERGGRGLHTLVAVEDSRLRPALAALVERVRSGQIKRLALERVDGEPALGSSLAALLLDHGFQEGPRRMTLRLPEGDTIAWAAKRIRPVLQGQVPDEILTPQPRHALDRWPERLAGQAVRSVDTHGKHLFFRFDGGLVLHSHLGMVGSWIVAGERRGRGTSPWIVFRVGDRWVVAVRGPAARAHDRGAKRVRPAAFSAGP